MIRASTRAFTTASTLSREAIGKMAAARAVQRADALVKASRPRRWRVEQLAHNQITE